MNKLVENIVTFTLRGAYYGAIAFGFLLLSTTGCEKTHTGDTYVIVAEDGSTQVVQLGNDDGNQAAADDVNAGEVAEKRLTPSDAIILHRVYLDGAWSDIWIDRQRGHEYAQVTNEDGSIEYVFVRPLE